MKIKVSNVNTPNWKEVTVKSRIPARHLRNAFSSVLRIGRPLSDVLSPHSPYVP